MGRTENTTKSTKCNEANIMSFPQAVSYSLLGDLSKNMPGISDITTAVKDSIIKATDKAVEETIKIGGKIVEKTVEEVTKSARNIAEIGVKSGIIATSNVVKTGIDTHHHSKHGGN